MDKDVDAGASPVTDERRLDEVGARVGGRWLDLTWLVDSVRALNARLARYERPLGDELEEAARRHARSAMREPDIKTDDQRLYEAARRADADRALLLDAARRLASERDEARDRLEELRRDYENRGIAYDGVASRLERATSLLHAEKARLERELAEALAEAKQWRIDAQRLENELAAARRGAA